MNPYDDMIIRLEDLSNAIEELTGVEDATEDAEYILDMFGFDDRIIDNDIEPSTRHLLYTLEGTGLLTTEREETVLYDGRNWRTFYWCFVREKIFNKAEIRRERIKQLANQDDAVKTYSDMSDDLWKKRRNT